MKYKAVASHHGSARSRMLRQLVSKFNVSIPSVAPLVKDVLEPLRGDPNWQTTGDEVFFHVHLCRTSLSQEYIDHAVSSMKSADAWSGLAEWIGPWRPLRLLYPEEIKNKHSRKEKSRLRLLMAAATTPRYQWYLNNA